jgi:hypothetical protein
MAEARMSEGWIALHRGWRDSPIFRGEFSRADAWVWLIEAACWKATRYDISGKTVTLARGQLCASVRQLADVWGWSKSAVDRFLTRLETETMIEREAGHGKLVLTVCNYAKYQDRAEAERDSSGTPTGTAAGQQRDIKEQGNKLTIEASNEASSAKPRKIAHALPTGWLPVLTPAAQSVVDGWPPGHFGQVLAAFLDHAADKGRVSKDWQAAFRTWLTNENKWNRPNGLPARQADLRPSAGSRGERRNPLLDLVRATEAPDYPEEDREPDWQGRPTLRAIGQIGP